ncbi:hypothetical protein FGG08_007295 [Glutinoglossum americanum]|uniref:Uncharacterized protein n=1 Tax=Glutinoglossum americanum TaxID=1670608 RepID=A0A9P8HZT5_9PEZI|nr:hypothetical protein FGG08_007295 [Glutinoglossum americanum]
MELSIDSDDGLTKSIAEGIHGQLDGIDSKQEKLVDVLHILDAAEQINEQVPEVVTAAWDLLSQSGRRSPGVRDKSTALEGRDDQE